MAHSDNKNADIEVLRGLAIVVTIYAHLRLLFPWSPKWFEITINYISPSVGVDLFFCISGYVITRTIVRHREECDNFKSFSIPFWIKRMWRLWPAALTWLAINFVCTWLFNWSDSFGPLVNTLKSSLSAVFQVTNLYFPYCINNQNCGSNMIYWSLSLEEQFYFIFPFLVYFLSKGSLKLVMFTMIALQFFLFRDAASLLWSIRTEAICSGVLLALYSKQILSLISRSRVLNKINGSWLFYLISLSVCLIPATHVGSMAGITMLVCFLSVAIAVSKPNLLGDGLANRVFIYLGSRSYAIYLCHEVIFRLINEVYMKKNMISTLQSKPAILFTVMGIMFILLMAEINFRFIETPLRTKGRQIATNYENKKYQAKDFS